MKRLLFHHNRRILNLVFTLVVALLVVETSGCQSLMNSRAKAKAAKSKDRFSCGENLPARNP